MKIREPYKKLPKTVKTEMEWDGGMGFVCKSGSGHEIKADASSEHGGKNTGARPMELLLFSLSSCTGMDVTTFLKKRKQNLDGLKISAYGSRTASHPHVFETITLEYIFAGDDLSDDDIRWAIDLSLEKYCSVAGMLRKICKINYHWKINKST